jgi:hypothetical protein
VPGPRSTVQSPTQLVAPRLASFRLTSPRLTSSRSRRLSPRRPASPERPAKPAYIALCTNNRCDVETTE